jgi:hypothetical protein
MIEQCHGVHRRGVVVIEFNKEPPGSKKTRWQNALAVLGNDGKCGSGTSDGNRGVDPGIVGGEADHGGDQSDQSGTTGIRDVVVDSAGDFSEERVGAPGVIAPPFTGQERGILHEARPFTRGPVLPTREQRSHLGRVTPGHALTIPDREGAVHEATRSLIALPAEVVSREAALWRRGRGIV